MRTKSVVVVAAFLSLAGVPCAAAQDVAAPQPSADAAKTGPRLTPSTTAVDLGEIDDSGIVSTTVTLTNTGDEVLEIGDISVTCGCTAGEIGTKSLRPGESTELTLNFDPRNRSGEQHGKRVTIASNDPTGSTAIGLSAWVLPRVSMDPPLAAFGNVLQGEGKTIQVSVKGMSTDFEVLGATIDREDAFTIKVIETRLTQREHPRTGELLEVGESIVEITMTDKARAGRIDGGIRLETNDPGSPVMQMRVTSVVQGDIGTEPTRVMLNALQPGQAFEETFKLVSLRGKPFRLEKATLVTSTLSAEDRDLIEISFAPIPAPEDENVKAEVGYLVTVKGTATETMKIIQGNIVALTDADGQRVVRTPIAGVVRPAPAAGGAPPAGGQ